MTTSKLQLPQVTLIAMTGIGYKTQEHIEAIKKSCEGIKFGEVKLIQLGTITNVESWNEAVIKKLPQFVDTDFAILIHHDGYITNPTLWNPSWLDWDYIGAPWPLPNDGFSYRTPKGQLIRVGNSVSLRSKKLMDLIATRPMEYHYGNNNEDGQICVWERDWLEEQGCKFAPLEVAKYFSKEHEIPENKDIKTFAFHSL